MSIFSKKTAALLCVLASGFSGASFAADAAQPAQAAPAATQQVEQASININSATAQEIASALKGVGLSKAQAIVDFRTLNGSFLQLEEITQVKGIGASTLEKNKDKIRFQ
ncbi:MAG TPA: hypothetical protein DHW71_14770 [Gammaproteobacteria bacterium]|nr:hypothetical protein [Gammaproteobacteria bacterium]HBF07664.1 hypothetical protein [Gammaproteobacteria bacterium]HCK94256.1 hypothetical protein [Gammaproteobacteria bacterium]|tara:strand:+ start:250 stop:579 length:330 start_codon:yes stop_codon:yes gene_type:complete